MVPINRYGQAARQAYDPKLCLRFIKTIEEGQSWRNSAWSDAVTGRTLRRWETQMGVTPWGLDNVLRCYTAPTGDVFDRQDFERWAGQAGRIR